MNTHKKQMVIYSRLLLIGIFFAVVAWAGRGVSNPLWLILFVCTPIVFGAALQVAIAYISRKAEIAAFNWNSNFLIVSQQDGPEADVLFNSLLNNAVQVLQGESLEDPPANEDVVKTLMCALKNSHLPRRRDALEGALICAQRKYRDIVS